MVPTAELLARHNPVFAPDLPGFGDSEKPTETLSVADLAEELATWMDAMDLDRAVLIANSLGCQVVVHLAEAHPERVEAAVLQGPTTDPQARSLPVQLGRLMIDAFREPPSLHPLVLRDYLKSGPLRVLRTFRTSMHDPIERRLPRLQVPTLVVRGARDPIVPQRWAEHAAELLPQGHVVVIPRAAHAVNYSQPHEFVRIIRAFLQEAEKATHPPHGEEGP